MIGIDIVLIKRFEHILFLEHRDAIVKKIFSEREIDMLIKYRYNKNILAGLFAAKEAVIKASLNCLKVVDLNRIEVSWKGKDPLNISGSEVEGVGRFLVSVTYDEVHAIGVAVKPE